MNPALERLRTIPALLKILCLVWYLEYFGILIQFDFICFSFFFQISASIDLFCTLLSSASNHPLVQFCWVMMIIAIIITTILLIVFIFAIERKIKLNWLEIELIFAGIASLTFMLISSLLIRADNFGLLRAGAVSTCQLFLKFLSTESNNTFVFQF